MLIFICLQIDHQYDTWHVAKNITKKLTAKAAVKDCTDLAPWIQSISNHLWWSCATCCEDEQLLRQIRHLQVYNKYILHQSI